MHTVSYEFLMKPEESAGCHQTLSSRVGAGHETKAQCSPRAPRERVGSSLAVGGASLKYICGCAAGRLARWLSNLCCRFSFHSCLPLNQHIHKVWDFALIIFVL